MTRPVPSSQPAPIKWEFQISLQGFVTRYGVMGGEYYRQYLPFGVRDDIAHPPKRIDAKLFQIAKQKHTQTQSRPVP